MKFTDEELSRVLSAHEGGQLVVGGRLWPRDGECYDTGCCVIQAASVMGDPQDAGHLDDDLATAFDAQYAAKWTTVALLRWLESQGVA